MIFLELHQNLLTTGEQVLVQDLRLSHTSEQLDHVKFLIQHLLPASKQTMVQVAWLLEEATLLASTAHQVHEVVDDVLSLVLESFSRRKDFEHGAFDVILFNNVTYPQALAKSSVNW